MDNYLKAAASIETALKHHVRPVAAGDQIHLWKTDGHEQANKDDVALVTQILKENKPELLAFLNSKEAIQGRLLLVQQKLIHDNEEFLASMESWGQLERVYAAVWPLDECITGDDGCPDNAIVRCTYCARNGLSKGMEE